MKVFSRTQKQELNSTLRKDKKHKRPLSTSKSHLEQEFGHRSTSSDNSSSLMSIFDSKANKNSDYTSESSENNNKKASNDGHVDLENYKQITRTNSVIMNDDFSNNSFYDVINSQVNKQPLIDEAESKENLDKNRKLKDEQVICDGFTIKDISDYLLKKQMNNCSGDFVECTDFLESMRKQKHITIGDIKKNVALNKIKHYMTEYYRLMEMQNVDSEYNPLKTIRDRELKLQLHNFGNKTEENQLTNTTRNFQKLMKNYQNVIPDPPLIPVLAFTERTNVSMIYQKFYKDTSEGGGPIRAGIDKSDNAHHHHSYYAYKLNHSTDKKAVTKYQYWKWFVGVNERYEDITIQKILHLKQEFMSIKDGEERKLSQSNKGNLNLLSVPNSESRNLSSGASELSLSDGDSFKEYADVNEGLSVPDGSEGKSITKNSTDSNFSKKGLSKVNKLIKNTIDSLESYEQSKLEKVLYYEALTRLLINRLDRFHYENDEQLTKLESFEIPSLEILELLKNDIVLDVPNCEKLTEISENNELSKMVLQMTHIQSEISTTLQLRLKKIGIDDFDADSSSNYSNVRHRKRLGHEEESLITNIGFWLIEWMIKIILISIKLSYGLYSLIFPSKNEKTSESSPALQS